MPLPARFRPVWLAPLLALLALGPLGTRRASSDEAPSPDPLALARGAATFVARQAKATPDGSGVRFPEYAEVPEELGDSLYAGSAGVLVFLENAAAVLEDPDLALLADRTARALDARVAAGETEASPGLYTGLAGIGEAFLVRARLRGDARATAVAVRVGDRLLASLRRSGRVAHWDGGYDVIAGAAGTALFLVDLAERTNEARFREAAARVGRWLVAEGRRDADAADGRTRWWPPREGQERHYPNFSHGTAGIAYALVRIARTTGDADCLDGAIEGARWLLAHAKREGGTLAVCHYLPGAGDRFREGWCHGPAGTARLFLALHDVTGEPRWLEDAEAFARWIRKQKPEAGIRSGRVRFYSPSLCCGAAGVLDLFVDLWRVTEDPAERRYAEAVGAYLARLAKEDAGALRWTNYDHPDEKGVVYHGVSLMLGASGEGLALLRLATLDRADDPIAWLPDRAVSFPRGGAGGGSRATAGRARTVPAPRSEPKREAGTEEGPRIEVTLPPAAEASDAYVVLTSRSSKGDPYREAAGALAAWRGGTVIDDFDPERPDEVLPRLRTLRARWVALVLPPGEIDTNTQRRFLMAAARIDDDPFVDVGYGFVTGTSKTPPLRMVERAKRLDRDGIRPRWVGVSVASGIKSTVYPGAGDPTAERAGYEGRHVYFGSREADPHVLDFVKRTLPTIEGGGVVSFGGCGDPEGTWLFSDRRNLEHEKHWDYDPARVGEDPDGEMPRVTADLFRTMKLDGTVVWTGVCHAGSISRVFVEGDIVSTFGRTHGHTEYVVPEARSVCTAILDAGAAAYVAPIGPNHGYRVLMESQEALEKRLPLGDVVRSTWNDVVVSRGHAPALDLYLEGGGPVDADRGEVMAGGGANRILYGDPRLSPFRDAEVAPAVSVTSKEVEGSFVVEAEVAAKDWWAWDQFASDGNAERIRVLWTVPDRLAASLAVEARAWNAEGEAVAVGRLDAMGESIDGRRLLHLQVAAPRGAGLNAVGARARFTISPGR